MKHYSALRIVTHRGHLADCSEQIAALTGIEVHHSDPATGQLIVVHESDTLDEQRRRLSEIQLLPQVIVADLVVHYIDSQDDCTDPAVCSEQPRGTIQ